MKFLLCFCCVASIASAEPVITFEEHIKPIFREHCMKCHGDDEQKADLNLSTQSTALKGGSGGVAVVAGRASTSLLFKAITNEDDADRMPPKKAPLPEAQIELIRQWIQGGLRETAQSKSLASARDTSFKPMASAPNDGPAPMPENIPSITPPATKRPLPIVAMAASPRAPLIAVAGFEHVQLLGADQKLIARLPYPEGQPNVIRFSQDGKLLMVAGGKPVQSGSVVLYDVKSGKRLTSVGDETDAVQAADISPDQQLIALGGSGKTVKVYGTSDGKLRYKLTKHTDWITAIAFSPDGKSLASADRAGGIYLWDPASSGILLSLAEHKASVRALAWRSDSRILASGGEDGQLIWWDAKDGWPTITNNNAHAPTRPAGYYGKLPNGVLAVAFGPQGELLTAGRDKQVRLWGSDGRAVKSFASDSDLPLQTSVTFDGKTLCAGDAAGVVHSWSALP